MSKVKLVATCLFGLEKLVGEEIDALGYTRRDTIDGRIYFEGPLEAIVRSNINLRCAERVLIEMSSFEAPTFTALFDGVKKIPWERFIGEKDAFPVKGHSIKSDLHSIPDCQKMVKKAIVERLRESYNSEWFEETGVKYQIEFFILNNRACIMMDTSGTPLHKRGYRTEANIAPIRETLAAGLVKLSRPREEVILWDPFCGSATIPIEASLIMTDTPPGLRRHFIAESYSFLDSKIWKNVREEAATKIKKDCEFKAFGSDIDGNILKTAAANLKRSGMEKYVTLFKKDAAQIQSDGVRTTIVCNPPYGERLETVRTARELYKKIGQNFPSLSPWQIYIITSDDEFERYYGKKADKARKLYNGMLKCSYYQYFKRNGG